jgi:hypothetical protein
LAAFGHAACRLIELIPKSVILLLGTLELTGQAFNSPGGILWQNACGVRDHRSFVNISVTICTPLQHAYSI